MIDDGAEVTSKIVFDLAKNDDYLANEVVDQVAFYLGYASANLANTLNPSAIVIGGGVSAAGPFLLERVKTNFMKFAFQPVRENTDIKLAVLGNDAGVYGAGLLSKQA